MGMGLDPTTVDTDGDTYSDGEEVTQGTNPMNFEDNPMIFTVVNDTPFFIPGFSAVTSVVVLVCIALVGKWKHK